MGVILRDTYKHAGNVMTKPRFRVFLREGKVFCRKVSAGYPRFYVDSKPVPSIAFLLEMSRFKTLLETI
jgi:hypothetical protein